MLTALYFLAINLYYLGIRLAALFGVRQAQLWVNGRTAPAPEQQLSHLRSRPKNAKILWMHCASLGEWEQGRPVLEALKKRLPDHEVVLTFFSPSGYERCKDSAVADYVTYLPADGPGNARKWVATLRPDLVIFVKYEFWYFHLKALQKAGVPLYLIAASFRPNQPFFRSWGGWWREMLKCYTAIMVQTPTDRDLLVTSAGQAPERVIVAGDPRMDRTRQLAAAPFTDQALSFFCAAPETTTIIAGSVWPQDVALWAAVWPALPERYRLVLAPHQLHESQIAEWTRKFAAARYSYLQDGEQPRSRVLLLDTIGILSRSYRFGDLAYVGGAFKTGLHNTLEPLAYGLPVIFGPRHHKFPEAGAALRSGGGFSVSTPAELQQLLRKLEDPTSLAAAQLAQTRLGEQLSGASERTAAAILALQP